MLTLRHPIIFTSAAWLLTIGMVAAAGKDDVPRLLDEARDAFRRGDSAKAVDLAGQAIAADPQGVDGYSFRGQLHAAMQQPQAAVDDFTKVIDRAPSAGLYELRGSEQFKLGNIDESIADFDREIKLAPAREREHWKRGISYYYAKRYDEGRKQFEAYQTFDDNDVENAVWRFLCMARGEGLEAARKTILKIRRDPRVPMMEVYDMFAGQLTPADVLKAVEAGEPSEQALHQRRFYAHLYLGLFFDATGDVEKAREHIRLSAEKYPVKHYMADVARVHHRRLQEKAAADKDQAKPRTN